MIYPGPNYDPPSKKNWVSTGYCDESFTEEYKVGYQERLNGKSSDENPHELSGHERDTTFSDELNYWWYCGWNDADADIHIAHHGK